jgi:serine/threonine-protein kinase
MLESLAHYKILDRIGAGGIGELYRARDTKLGRTVSIEVLSSEIAGNPARRSEFLADARAASALSHPNIAALYEAGEENDLAYIVCEFVPGTPLSTMVSNRSLNARRAVDFATQLADAVADAHADGIAHRNLVPAAVTVTPKDKVKIIGFGLSAWSGRGAHPAAAAAPASEADFQNDLKALGLILYEMLTGKQPAPVSPTPPTSINANVPAELDAIALKAISCIAGDQYGSAATLAAELRSVAAILDVRSGDREPPILAPERAKARTGRPLLVAVLILIAIGALVWLGYRGALRISGSF